MPVAPSTRTREKPMRAISSIERQPIRVLTTDGEFHSLARQVARLEEDRLLAVRRIPSEPAPDCLPRLIEAARAERFDLIWVLVRQPGEELGYRFVAIPQMLLADDLETV